MNWGEFRSDAGQLGEIAHRRLIGPKVLFVATSRADGTPRVSPVEPLVLDDELWLSMMWQSRKASDLARDPRVLIHNIITGPQDPEGELKLRGTALAEHDPDRRQRYSEEVSVLGWRPEEPFFHLFRIDIDDVTLIRYRPNGDQEIIRWPARVEVLRHAVTETRVGAPVPTRLGILSETVLRDLRGKRHPREGID